MSDNTFDWEQAREKLNQLAAALAAAGEPSAEEAKQIMSQRARELAEASATFTAPARVREVVKFLLARETFALETKWVREVMRLGDVTPVPGAPPFLLGVMNLRGEILPLVDLRRFFRLEESPPSDTSRVLVLGESRPELGLVVDQVAAVVGLHEKELHASAVSVPSGAQEFLLGVTVDALLVLDGASLLSNSQLVVDEVESLSERGVDP